MTLLQAIDHAKEIAAEQENLIEMVGKDPKFENDLEGRAKTVNHCKQCATDHKQLAAWLTELNAYRETIEAFKQKSDFTGDAMLQFIDDLGKCAVGEDE